MNVLDVFRKLSFEYDFDFFEIHFDVFNNNDEFKIFDFIDVKLAFVNVQIKIDDFKFDKNLAYMNDMFFFDVVVYQNIVQINAAKRIQILIKSFIDIKLKRFEGIAKIEKHHYVFIQSVSRQKSCFVFVVFDNAYFIENNNHVQLNIVFNNTQTN